MSGVVWEVDCWSGSIGGRQAPQPLLWYSSHLGNLTNGGQARGGLGVKEGSEEAAFAAFVFARDSRRKKPAK